MVPWNATISQTFWKAKNNRGSLLHDFFCTFFSHFPRSYTSIFCQQIRRKHQLHGAAYYQRAHSALELVMDDMFWSTLFFFDQVNILDGLLTCKDDYWLFPFATFCTMLCEKILRKYRIFRNISPPNCLCNISKLIFRSKIFCKLEDSLFFKDRNYF